MYRPGRWLAFSIGIVFLVAGAIGFVAIGGAVPFGMPFWIARAVFLVFAVLGCTVLAWAISSIISTVHVRHAAPDVLPNVPTEPVILEGSVVHGRLTHELIEDSSGWQFRPAQSLWRNDIIFLLGFGIPFLTLFSGILSWIFHGRQIVRGWTLSILCGISATALCGGSACLLIGMIMRSGYRRLCCLSIPRNGGELELDSAEEPDPEEADLAAGLKWVILGKTQRQRLSIPRELVVAVQLCPWKFVAGSEIAWAVQGSLVLACSEEGGHVRQPLLLTSDFVGAARLMQRLGTTLHVPYLFCADADGWSAEEIRAKKRRPLRIGGMQS
ncbi:MAG: hypothetical protein JSS49_04775 [Planctomycetes bacterium]|nr:hypothetical protein [Planctomycetota bacterium]